MSHDDHLTPEELAAAQDGKLDNPERVEHLTTCSVCRKQVDDARWVTSLSGESGEWDTPSAEHLDPEEIEAYRMMALPTDRVYRIKRHLRSCSRCLAIYERGRKKDAQSDYPSTPGALLRKARRSFRSDRKRWLGTVLLTGLDVGPTAVLLPERRVASGEELFAGDSDYRSPYREDIASEELTARQYDIESPTRTERGWLGRIFSRGEQPPPDDPAPPPELDSFPVTLESEEQPLSLEAGDYRLDVLPAGSGASDRVTLRLVKGGKGVRGGNERPVAGARVRLRNKAGRRDEDRTDRNGTVRLAVPPGQSHVEIGVKPPLVISLQRAD